MHIINCIFQDEIHRLRLYFSRRKCQSNTYASKDNTSLILLVVMLVINIKDYAGAGCVGNAVWILKIYGIWYIKKRFKTAAAILCAAAELSSRQFGASYIPDLNL